MAKDLTDKQLAAMDALQAARSAGVGLSTYAKAHGLNARQLHDSVVALRRRGLLPPTDRPRPRKASFVAVRVVNAGHSSPVTAVPPRMGMVCRLVHASGFVLECGEWPPVSWMWSLTRGPRDAEA